MIVKADAVPSGSPLPEGLKAEVARLVEQAQFEGVQLTGEGGLLPDMIKQAVEAALQGEMTAHLGYERYAPEGRGSGNSRNGSTAKTVQTAAGAAEVSVPRDRAGSFEPITVPKGTRRVTEFDDMVIGLYCQGIDHPGYRRVARPNLRRQDQPRDSRQHRRQRHRVGQDVARPADG